MPSLTTLSEETLAALASDIAQSAKPAATIESAAQDLAASVFRALEGSAVLARVYVTEQYGNLPDANRSFVAHLAESKDVTHELRDATPVLSLSGTLGTQAEWCDRHKSQGHVGIPLTSSSFITAVPMVAALLQQMGIGIHWLDEADPHIRLQENRASGSFYVEDAATETDANGNKVIPAEDFVSEHSVHSVFGVGDAYHDGRIAVLIVFCNELVPEDALALLKPTVDAFVEATAGKPLFG